MRKSRFCILLLCILIGVSTAVPASMEDMDAESGTGLAVVGEPYYEDEDGEYLGYVYGNILDENGEKLLENDWILLDNADNEDLDDLVIVLQDTGESYLYGFFDKQSRFFCEPRFAYISFFTNNEAKLVAVCEDELWGFCDRATGELIIPCQYDGVWDDFRNGYALVIKASDDFWSEEYLLIDQRGEAVAFPDHVMPFSAPNESGYLVIASADDELYGVGDVHGNIVIPPTLEEEPAVQTAYAE